MKVKLFIFGILCGKVRSPTIVFPMSAFEFSETNDSQGITMDDFTAIRVSFKCFKPSPYLITNG